MKQILYTALALLMLTSMPAKAQIEEVTLPDGSTIKVDRSVFPDLRFDQETPVQPAQYVARRKARAEGREKAIELPPYVYNNESKYFPPIFSQDGGSCGSAQAIGYMFTHEMNALHGTDARIQDNQFPTHFTWLQAYQTSNTEGMATHNGIPNVTTYGGRTYSRLFGSQTHDDPDYGWMQGYDKWYSAMWNRLGQNFSLSNPMTPSGRQELKEWLYNHSGDDVPYCGGVCGIGVAAYGTWDKTPTSEANKANGFVGKKYVKAWGDALNHAVTIAGYDDRIEFDLDGDGIVGEVDEDEVGAWIIVNSWGNWENGGWIYCPYKYSCPIGTDKGTWSPGCYYIRRNYRPQRVIKLTMEYSRRSELLLSAGATQKLNATKPTNTVVFDHFQYAGNTKGASPAPEVPMLGRWADGMHYEPMEFGYDLTDLTANFDRTKPIKYFFIVKTKSDAIGTGLIHKAAIMNYETDSEGIEIPFDESNVEILNQGKETIITVTVPGEQIYPASNLELADGVLGWSAPQSSSLHLLGYHVYEGSNLIATVPATQLYYTLPDGAEGPFSIRAFYKAGAYDVEAEATNAVTAEILDTDKNYVLNLSESGLIVPDAVPDNLPQATIEFWMYNKSLSDNIQQVGSSWGTFLFHTDSNGRLYAGWNTSSGDRLQLYGQFRVNTWYHVAIVIDGNTMAVYVNGVKRGTITSTRYSGLPGFGKLKIGRGGSDSWWNGCIDELRIWKTARTLTDIKNNMRIPIARPAQQPDLLVYLPMDLIEVNGKTMVREMASGKHASFQSIGSWEQEENDAVFSGTQSAPKLEIADNSSTHAVGLPVCLTAKSSLSATDWTWEAPGAHPATCHGVTPSFIFDTAGTYTITCTASFATGDVLTATKEVTIANVEAPVADFTMADAELPAGDRFYFVNRSTGEGCTYHWSLPGAEEEEVDATNVSVLYPEVGTFRVTLTATNPGGTNSVTKEVTVRESAPAARFDISSTAIMLGDTIQLIDDSRYNPSEWHWELNNGYRALTVDGQSPFIVPTSPGIYDVSLTAVNSLGEQTTTKGNILTVSNDDAVTCLSFTGKERLRLDSPLAADTRYMTLEWWMRPQELEGCVNLHSETGDMAITADDTGALTVHVNAKETVSDLNFIVKGEWHHYAVTYSLGAVKFYRDGALISAPTTRVVTRLPAFGAITMGTESQSLSGQIDEVRVWGKALSADQLRQVANSHIADVAAAESDLSLLLYYDFNQTGGDVLDRSSGGHNAQRIGFGPDGDAWDTSLGIFTLETDATLTGDLAATYLTNYKNPFTAAAGTVNTNNSSRFLKLAMGTTKSKWKDANAVVKSGVTTGAHLDTSHNRDITFETQWSGFADPLLDYRLWQAVTLPAGRYTFGVTFGDGDNCQESRLVVCQGNTMVADADCEQDAIAWCLLKKGELSFELKEETEVSLGIIVNLEGQQSFNINAFHLEGVRFDRLEPVIPTAINLTPAHREQDAPAIFYDLSGRRIPGKPQRGIYLHNGKKKAPL